MSVGNAGPPDPKSLYYPQLIQGVTLKVSLLQAFIGQNNNKNKLKYSQEFNCITQMLVKKSTIPGGNPGSPNTKYLNYPQGMEDITLKNPFLPTCINQ